MGIDVNETGRRILPAAISAQGTAGFDIREQNNLVSRWTSMVQRKLRSGAAQFVRGKDRSVQRPGRMEYKLSDSIKTRTRKTYGITDSASFLFERHGVFVHKGVGRGYKLQGGMVHYVGKPKQWYEEEKYPPRHPAEWFNPVLDESLPELADKIAEINADAVVNATKMMIK